MSFFCVCFFFFWRFFHAAGEKRTEFSTVGLEMEPRGSKKFKGESYSDGSLGEDEKKKWDVFSAAQTAARERRCFEELKNAKKRISELEEENKQLHYEVRVVETNYEEMKKSKREKPDQYALKNILKPPYPSKKLWFGIDNIGGLVNDWKLSLMYTKNPGARAHTEEDMLELLFWMRQGWTYKQLRFLRGTSPSNAKKSFMSLISGLEVSFIYYYYYYYYSCVLFVFFSLFLFLFVHEEKKKLLFYY